MTRISGFSPVIFYKEEQPYLACAIFRSHFHRESAIQIWNLNANQCEATLDGYKDIITSITKIESNVTYLVSRSYNDTIKFWDLENFSLLKTIKVESYVDFFCAFYSNNRQYVVSVHIMMVTDF